MVAWEFFWLSSVFDGPLIKSSEGCDGRFAEICFHQRREQCDQMLKLKVAQFSISCPKNSHSSSIEYDDFKNCHKSRSVFELLLWENFVPRTFQNCPLWSHFTGNKQIRFDLSSFSLSRRNNFRKVFCNRLNGAATSKVIYDLRCFAQITALHHLPSATDKQIFSG